jgi:hypothetical protein
MTSWRCYWVRRQQKRKALSLLSLSGAIRTADIEARYFGAERSVGRPGSAAGRPLEADITSIWGMDLRVLLKQTGRRSAGGEPH